MQFMLQMSQMPRGVVFCAGFDEFLVFKTRVDLCTLDTERRLSEPLANEGSFANEFGSSTGIDPITL